MGELTQSCRIGEHLYRKRKGSDHVCKHSSSTGIGRTGETVGANTIKGSEWRFPDQGVNQGRETEEDGRKGKRCHSCMDFRIKEVSDQRQGPEEEGRQVSSEKCLFLRTKHILKYTHINCFLPQCVKQANATWTECPYVNVPPGWCRSVTSKWNIWKKPSL